MPSSSLLLILVLPLLGGVLLPLLSGVQVPRTKLITASIPAVQLLITLLIWLHPPADLTLAWVPQLGLNLDLGVDGLSLPLMLLAALLTVVAILASAEDQARPRLFFPLILATNLGLMGAFLARNALLFVLCNELMMIPITLLLAIWGGKQRVGAAIRFLMFAAVSGLCLVAAVLALGWLNGNGFSFAYADLAQADLSPRSRGWILALLLLGFGLKLPVVPLHGWQPLAYSQASTPVVILLSGGVCKLAAYGLLRFGVGFLPESWASWSVWIASAGAASAIYGALNAIAQADMRRMVAYSSLGHMGLLVLALAAATPLSLQGAVAQVLAHGMIVPLLFIVVGLIEAKTGTTTIADISGLMNPLRGLPLTMTLLLMALMASAGVPGQAGFVAEFLVFQGSWSAFPWPTLLCLVASGFTAVYAVRLFNRVGFGRLDNDRVDYPTTSWGERLPAVVLSLLIVVGGLWPPLLVGWSEPATAALSLRTDPFTSTLIATAPLPTLATTSR